MTKSELASKTLEKELSRIHQANYLQSEGYYVNDSDNDGFILTNIIWRACADFNLSDKALYNFNLLLNNI